MTVLIQNGASISVEGETVTEAWIGVTNSNGVVVALYYGLMRSHQFLFGVKKVIFQVWQLVKH